MSIEQDNLSKSFPGTPYELSAALGLSTPDGFNAYVFVPYTDGTFTTATKIVTGVISTFVKGIPVFADFTKITITTGGIGVAYKH